MILAHRAILRVRVWFVIWSESFGLLYKWLWSYCLLHLRTVAFLQIAILLGVDSTCAILVPICAFVLAHGILLNKWLILVLNVNAIWKVNYHFVLCTIANWRQELLRILLTYILNEFVLALWILGIQAFVEEWCRLLRSAESRCIDERLADALDVHAWAVYIWYIWCSHCELLWTWSFIKLYRRLCVVLFVRLLTVKGRRATREAIVLIIIMQQLEVPQVRLWR